MLQLKKQKIRKEETPPYKNCFKKMKTLLIIVALFVSVSSFAQKVQIIEEELEEKPFGMKYDNGMPISYHEDSFDAKFPSMEDIQKPTILDNIWNEIQEEKDETSFLIRNDLEDTAHLIRNDIYDDEA